MWEQLKKILNKSGDTSVASLGLSPNLLENNNTLLPHLIEHLGEQKVSDVLSKAGVTVLNESVGSGFDFEVVYTSSSFVIIKDDQQTCAYSNNPLDSLEIYQIENKARELNVQIDMVGYISANHRLFNQDNKHKDSSMLMSNSELIEAILSSASAKGVSDIHIYPRNCENIAVMFRLFGEIIESDIGDISLTNYSKFANKIIALAGGNGGSYSQYLEAQFDYKKDNVDLSIRLQQNPSVYKFKDSIDFAPSFILRLHDKSAQHSFKSLQEIGFTLEQQGILKGVAQRNSGLVIVAGPTGSGKTTALYSVLAQSVRGRARIVQTVEDPVEIIIPGIKQTNINTEAGITYEGSIKSILRSDADVALIGEIRDQDTAKGVIELDRVGHLVFATIHTKSTGAIIERLREFNIESRHIADALSAIVSTRLVKKVCTHCSTKSAAIGTLDNRSVIKLNLKYDNKPSMEQSLGMLGVHDSKLEITEKEQDIFDQNQLILKQLRLGSNSKHRKHFDSKQGLSIVNRQGCQHCNSGYSGRVLVSEVWMIDPQIRRLITENASMSTIEEQVKSHNNLNIWQQGYDLVERGITTIEALEANLPTLEVVGKNYSADESNRI